MTELIRNQKQKKQWEIAQKMEIPQHIPKLKKKKKIFRKHCEMSENKHEIYQNCRIQIEKSLEEHLYLIYKHLICLNMFEKKNNFKPITLPFTLRNQKKKKSETKTKAMSKKEITF